MIEVKGNIFDFIDDPETNAICITTNGIVAADGQALMGAGTAGECSRRYPLIRKILGERLTNAGNIPHLIGVITKNDKFWDPTKWYVFHQKQLTEYKCLIFSFPTKHDWRQNADLDLIKMSSEKMMLLADRLKLKKVALPFPGIGKSTGRLAKEDVKSVIETILDDRFVAVVLE